MSGAQVKVYKGNDLIETYNVPINMQGTRWNIFEIRNGEIKGLSNITPKDDRFIELYHLGDYIKTSTDENAIEIAEWIAPMYDESFPE